MSAYVWTYAKCGSKNCVHYLQIEAQSRDEMENFSEQQPILLYEDGELLVVRYKSHIYPSVSMKITLWYMTLRI